jgi:hypothetical protein
MADRRTVEPAVILIIEPSSGVPIARELKGGGGAHGGLEPKKLVFLYAGLTPAPLHLRGGKS